ncbi:hypothetical protein ACQUSR_01765 [Streptomyces sp. P1-3]
MISDMFRYAFPKPTSALADAPKAAVHRPLVSVAACLDGARS